MKELTFADCTKQIQDLKVKIWENNKSITHIRVENKALRDTIELLKQKRREIIGIGRKIKP